MALHPTNSSNLEQLALKRLSLHDHAAWRLSVPLWLADAKNWLPRKTQHCLCVQVEEENRQLRAKLKQLTTAQDQSKVCIDQLLSRLQDVESARRSEHNTVDALRQQANAYREDFEGERLDRHRAQERVVNLERQVATLKNRVRLICDVFEYYGLGFWHEFASISL